MFPLLKIYCPNEIKQALLGKAAVGSPPERGVVPPGFGAEDTGEVHSGTGGTLGLIGTQQRLARWR